MMHNQIFLRDQYTHLYKIQFYHYQVLQILLHIQWIKPFKNNKNKNLNINVDNITFYYKSVTFKIP